MLHWSSWCIRRGHLLAMSVVCEPLSAVHWSLVRLWLHYDTTTWHMVWCEKKVSDMWYVRNQLRGWQVWWISSSIRAVSIAHSCAMTKMQSHSTYSMTTRGKQHESSLSDMTKPRQHGISSSNMFACAYTGYRAISWSVWYSNEEPGAWHV